MKEYVYILSDRRKRDENQTGSDAVPVYQLFFLGTYLMMVMVMRTFERQTEQWIVGHVAHFGFGA